jgi:hypothetical protein
MDAASITLARLREGLAPPPFFLDPMGQEGKPAVPTQSSPALAPAGPRTLRDEPGIPPRVAERVKEPVNP